MHFLKTTNETEEQQSLKKIGRKIISLSNASLPTITILIIAAIVFKEYGAIAWGTFVSEFLWLNIAAKIANYGSKEYILSKAGDDREETAELIHESINAGMIFIPIFFFLCLLLPFGLTHVIWLTIWLSVRYLYQAYEPFYQLYEKQKSKLTGELISALSIILILFAASENFSVIYLLQLFVLEEVIKTGLAYFSFRNIITLQLRPTLNFTYLKNNFYPFAIIFSLLFKSRIDQLIGTICLSTEETAVYQIYMTIILMMQSVLYGLSQKTINKIYTLTHQTISEIANKVIIRGIIPVTAFTFISALTAYYIYSYEAGSIIITSSFFILLSYLYSLSYVFALHKAKEEKSVIQINLVAIIITGLMMPYIMLHYAITGAFLLLAGTHILQAILLKARVKKLL